MSRIVIVVKWGRGGGNFYSPRYINVVELVDGTEYRSIKSKNVIKVHSRKEFNGCSTQGPKSLYAKLMQEAEELAARLKREAQEAQVRKAREQKANERAQEIQSQLPAKVKSAGSMNTPIWVF